MTNPYDIVMRAGFKFDQITLQALDAARNLYGGQFELLQGSYDAGAVKASAGTHDGGGAVDVAATADPARVVRALRVVGFAAWHRLPSQGPWGEHIHAVLNGDARLSPAAAAQVQAYIKGRDGLADNGPDTEAFRPRVILPYVWKDPTIGSKAVAAAIKPSPGAIFKTTVLDACRTALNNIPTRRAVQRAAVVGIRTIARTIRTP